MNNTAIAYNNSKDSSDIESLINQKQFDEAENRCVELLNTQPDDVQLNCQLAKVYLAQGRIDDAAAKARVINNEHPNLPEIQLIMAHIAINRKDTNAATDLINKVLDEKPDFIEAIIFKARLLLTLKQADEAIAILRSNIEKHPGNLELKGMLGLIYEKQQDWKKAADVHEQVLKNHPGYFASIKKLAGIYLNAGELEKAKKNCEEALKIQPNDASTLANYGMVMERESKPEKALEYYNKAIAANSNIPLIHFKKGDVLQKLKQYQEAAQAFKESIKLNPKFVEAYNKLGVTYQALGNMDMAMIYFNKGLEAQPKINPGRFMGAQGLPSHKMISYKYGDDVEQSIDWGWYRGENCNFIASKTNLKEPEAAHKYILKGWLPKKPFINKDHLITTFGSCFAASVGAHLEVKGYKVAARNHNWLSSHVIRFSSGMVNSFSILQQFEWAFENKKFNENLWYGSEKELAEYNEAIRDTTKDIFNNTDIFIITLGLSEVWCNKQTSEVFWRSIPERHFDENIHGFRVTTVQENQENLEKIYALIRKHRPNANMIFTLSPVKLRATFRPVSCLTANSVSKAILRTAVDEFYRNHEGDAGLFYFPSYELVTEYFADPYENDNNHIKSSVTNEIMKLFEQGYLS